MRADQPHEFEHPEECDDYQETLAIVALIVGGFAGRRGEEGRAFALIGAGLGAATVVWFAVWAVASSR